MNDMDSVYKQNLEDDIITQVAKIKNISLRDALNIYYKSRLARQINDGSYGIENMDFKYLANDLIENESELFKLNLQKRGNR